MHTPETLITKAAEVRQLLLDAADALGNLDVLESVTLLALAHPEIAWEPVAIAAAALNAKRDQEQHRAAVSDPLGVTVSLPLPPRSSVGVGAGGVSLPLPPWVIM